MHEIPFARIPGLQIILLLLFSGPLCHAQQFSFSLYGDAGRHSLTDGVYTKPALIADYSRAGYTASLGVQWTFSSADRKVFSGWQVAIEKKCILRDFPFSVNLFSVVNPYSDLVREVNAGVFLEHHRDHLRVHLGNASRVYGLKKKSFAATVAEPDPSLRIVEYRNFTYYFAGYLKDLDSKWNIGAGISNIDNFRVQQETNPMFMVTGYTGLLTGLSLNAELWMQGAGMTNLSAEIFGFYGRIGLRWVPGSKSEIK